tara:strand:- start:62720 stop:62908 length:189 start_codon:yes stop_codon:yes gene_type:complete
MKIQNLPPVARSILFVGCVALAVIIHHVWFDLGGRGSIQSCCDGVFLVILGYALAFFNKKLS